MSACIFPGRFQPFHNGQLLVVKGMIKSCSRSVIVICCGADDQMGSDDLFTSDQIREMISAALLAEDIVDAEIVIVYDCDEDEEWLDKIIEAADNPDSPTIWSGNENVLALAEAQGIASKKISLVPGHVSKEIREMIKSGDRGWMEKMPAGAIDVVMDWKEGKRE
ncbi:MAG: hypothetical protein ABH826_01460 [Patescibacteria group bacterium]|nr:hypothetical protein [Patescibacteria group bacterium]